MSTDISLRDLDLVEVAALTAKGEVSAVEVLEATLAAAHLEQPRINAAIWFDEERARAAARSADLALRQGEAPGPLHGIPLAHKDLFLQAGQRATCGSPIFRDRVADRTAPVIERLGKAGAYSFAGLNLAEFALNPTGHNHTFGHCRNPWNTAYVPGGSSSGSAAAVAARVTFASLGTDTGGSVRMPASACGVTGLKPTQTRVSRAGVAPGSSFSYENVGPITRTARDNARILSVIAGHDLGDPTTSKSPVPDYESGLDGDLRGQRIGVLRDDNLAADDAVRRNTDAAAEVLRGRGASLADATLPLVDEINAYSSVITFAETAAAYGPLLRDPASAFSDFFRARIVAAHTLPAAWYVEALSHRGRLLRAFLDTAFATVDVLVLPTIPVAVPRLDVSDIDDGDDSHWATAMSITGNVRLFNYLGLPALSVPSGFDANGLPTGLQIIGRPFGEARLLKIGDALQRDTDWHRRKPAR